jgi:hypothetical protein
METGEYQLPGNSGSGGTPSPVSQQLPLHRLAAVRRLQKVSRRTIAQSLCVDVTTVKEQETETSDLLLSTLYRWQELLEVPASELLIEPDDPLSHPIRQRAQMVRVMKTVLAIRNRAKQASVRRMAQDMIQKLVKLMPELKGVNAWHSVGQRRRRDEYGRAADRRFTPGE